MPYVETAAVITGGRGRFGGDRHLEGAFKAARMVREATDHSCVRCQRRAVTVTGDGRGDYEFICGSCSERQQRMQSQVTANRRELEQLEAEIRAEHVPNILTGIAVPYNFPTQLEDGVVEWFRPGAFGSLRSATVTALIDHDRTRQVASTTDGTLRLLDDLAGLRFEIDVRSDAARAERLSDLAAAGLRGVSIAFTARQENRAGKYRREVVSATLHEVSIMVRGNPRYGAKTWAALKDDKACRRLVAGSRAALEREIARL